MKIHIQYYALMREQANCSHELIDTTATTGRELYRELRNRHPFTLDVSQLRIALNGAFAELDAPLTEGVEVVFIPPVAGG
jgi:molybdopterin converting factor subunit 1